MNPRKLTFIAAIASSSLVLSLAASDARLYGLCPGVALSSAFAQPLPSPKAGCTNQGQCWNNEDPCPNGVPNADTYTQCCQSIAPNHCAIVQGVWKLCGTQWKKHCKQLPVSTSTCIPPDCI
jgi:hypothetical protein